jgi:uncharacterized phage-associated protein
MKIKNFGVIGSSPQSDVVIRKAYRSFRKAGHSPLTARLFLRSLFLMGENVGAEQMRKVMSK